ncbi:DUF6348 family protein [Terricaulis silvestris]|uniref:Uncharacterized protein n=1 Tax=Terricaulis silvestris TaxID=2686094 RepID=A0A6I6N057_9CAUL|nr:DUF6348 family protein [Terricaulis silvestris]QGZ96693.1 hypothetical protein DSM104635_03554 [Terricaulis silvestris]
MSQDLLSELLAEALVAHGIRFSREGGALVLQDAPMAFRTDVQKSAVHPNSVVMQVAFATEAAALDGRVIWNVFAGVGENEGAAIKNGFMKFLLGPFHVLVSALGGHVCSKGSEEWRELCNEGGSKWSICDSPLITQGFDNPASVPFGAVQTALENAFTTLSPSGVHWVEAFFAFLNGKRTALDVQLDGNAWPEGTQIVEGWDFQPGPGYKSGRYFFIALSARI